MGFFDVVKRLAKGEPPFVVPQDKGQADTDQPQPDSAESPRREAPKERPEVELERVVTFENGDRLDIDCIIQNNSNDTIELDKIRFIGTSRELDSYLRPGEERQYRIYSGSALRQSPQGYAELYYKDSTGDYFCAIHRIEYQKNADGTYEIEDFDLTYPIKDI